MINFSILKTEGSKVLYDSTQTDEPLDHRSFTYVERRVPCMYADEFHSLVDAFLVGKCEDLSC